MCVKMRVIIICKHGFDITPILVMCMNSHAWFGNVRNMSMYQENLFGSRNKQNFPPFVELFFKTYFIKAIEDFFFSVYRASSKHPRS